MAPPNPCSPRRAWKRFTVARYHSTGRRNGDLREATWPCFISEKRLDGSMNPAVPAAIPSERTNCRRDSICSASCTGKGVPGHDVFYSDSTERQSAAASVLLHRSIARQAAQKGNSAGKDSSEATL